MLRMDLRTQHDGEPPLDSEIERDHQHFVSRRSNLVLAGGYMLLLITALAGGVLWRGVLGLGLGFAGIAVVQLAMASYPSGRGCLRALSGRWAIEPRWQWRVSALLGVAAVIVHFALQEAAGG